MKRPILGMVGPALFFLALMAVVPLALNVALSLRSVTLENLRLDWPYAGSANYGAVLSDARVHSSFLSTAGFVLGSVVLSVLIGSGFALLLFRNLPGSSFFRTVQLVPLVATPIVIAISWRFLLDPTFGLLRPVFMRIGLSSTALLSSPRTALATVVLIDVWIWTPLVTLIVLGALNALPREPYEAAGVDGASTWQQFRYVTLPLLRPALLIATTLRVVDSLKTFGVVWVLTKGGPGVSTNLIGLEIYQRGLKFYHFAEAASLGLILLVITTAVCNIFFRTVGRQN